MRNIMTEVRFLEPGDNWTEPGDINYIVYKNEAVSLVENRVSLIVAKPNQRLHKFEMNYSSTMPMAICRP